MNKLVSFVLSFYLATVIYTNAFFVTTLTVAKASDQLFWNKLGIFVIILLPVYFIVNKFVAVQSGRGGMQVLRIVLVSLATLGLVVAFFYHVIPLAPLYHFPKLLDPYFASASLFTIWLIVPLVVLFI